MMDLLIDNMEWIFSGLGVVVAAALARYFAKLVRGKAGKRTARILIKVPLGLTGSDMEFGLLHVRDGKDDVEDRGPLLNKTKSFKAVDERGTLAARIKYSKRLGFQFKCFVDHPGMDFAEVKGILKKAGFPAVEKGGGKQQRAWFLHPDYPTCKTVDQITNNFFYPE
ncbi:MAG: hypothetical protein GY842_29005 [bacterium]|nr:hypothetical protein [bacterium]